MRSDYAQKLLEKVKDDYNRAAVQFSKRRQTIWPEMRFLFDDYLLPGDRVLDLGCGNGRFFETIQDKNVNYIGLDISEKLIEIARQKYPQARFLLADGLNLPFPNNYFDKVYCMATLHHIPSKERRCQFLKEVKRVLKENGLLILTTWNLWASFKKIKQIVKFALLKISGRSKLDFKDVLLPFAGIKDCYFHCFTKRELEKSVKAIDFRINQSSQIIVSQEKRPNSNFYIVAEK